MEVVLQIIFIVELGRWRLGVVLIARGESFSLFLYLSKRGSNKGERVERKRGICCVWMGGGKGWGKRSRAYSGFLARKMRWGFIG